MTLKAVLSLGLLLLALAISSVATRSSYSETVPIKEAVATVNPFAEGVHHVTFKLGQQREFGLHFSADARVKGVIPINRTNPNEFQPSAIVVIPSLESDGLKVEITAVFGKLEAGPNLCKTVKSMRRELLGVEYLYASRLSARSGRNDRLDIPEYTVTVDGQTTTPGRSTAGLQAGVTKASFDPAAAPTLSPKAASAQNPCGRPTCPYCTCGELECWPAPGKCIGCGECGRCCNTATGEGGGDWEPVIQ